MCQPRPLFLFIFVLFKHNLYRKTVGVSGIRTRIVGVEGEHADHLTTTTALIIFTFLMRTKHQENLSKFNKFWQNLDFLQKSFTTLFQLIPKGFSPD